MNMDSIVQRCTEKFSNKLRAALEEAERQDAEGVKVEIKIHIADEDEPFTETEAAEDAEDAEDMRERMETALLEYIERLAAGEIERGEGQPDLVEAVEWLDKLLSRREE